MKKTARLQCIRNFILEMTFQSQDELLKILHSKGYNITQATLSRDLKTLGVARVYEPGSGYRYIIPGLIVNDKDERTVSQLAGHISSVIVSGNTAVIRTTPGFATGIASEIDRHQLAEIAGTVAGDDTIIAVLHEGTGKSDFIRSLVLHFPILEKLIR
ncbi:MAG: ArgR family transcriptional regulator [Bacteroidota bacterium]